MCSCVMFLDGVFQEHEEALRWKFATVCVIDLMLIGDTTVGEWRP